MISAKNIYFFLFATVLIVLMMISKVTTSKFIWNKRASPTAADKLIVDIDPGIDDMEGLVLLLNEHNKKTLEIVAIVITEGNTEQRHGIENAFRLLQLTNRLDIPVFAGSYLPILPHESKLENYYGKDGFGDLSWTIIPPIYLLQQAIAPTIIKRIVDKYPEQITYIVLGPMTNLALSMRMYNGLAGKLKQIYAMGGLYNKQKGEFNMLYDPESAEIVFSMLDCPMSLFTWQACVTNAPIRTWFENVTITNPVYNMVLAAERSLKQMHPDDLQWISCDPMTIVTYLNSKSILKSFEAPLVVNLDHGNERGIIRTFASDVNNTLARHPINVIMELDYEVAQEDFLKSFDEICKTHPCS